MMGSKILSLCCCLPPFLSVLLGAGGAAGVYGLEHRNKIWPACQGELYSQSSELLRTISVAELLWVYTGESLSALPILDAAKTRFERALTNKIPPPNGATSTVNASHKEVWPVPGIRVNIRSELTSFPATDNDANTDINLEEYRLEIPPVIDNDGYIMLFAETYLGVLRGIQTLIQLIEFGWFDDKKEAVFTIDDTPITIVDGPTYAYRGLLIDTSRHYLPLPLILQNLDAMEMTKLNVLHWHLTDSQSWAYQSPTFPELSQHGAYCRSCIYTVDDIQTVVDEATNRGIRVVVELDVPGHSRAIGASHPEMIADCGHRGHLSDVLDATLDNVYTFVHTLYRELIDSFPDPWMHVGGDEVDVTCWNTTSSIKQWMRRHRMTQPLQLLHYFERDLLQYVTKSLRKRPIVWQELFDSGVQLPTNAVVDVWKDWGDGLLTRERATAQNYTVILSPCWYLDHLDSDWKAFYKCDPRGFNGTTRQKELVVGGHASMWGERVDETNFFERVWPRAAAAAEQLWTGQNAMAQKSSEKRLTKFRCNLLEQGFRASPIGPGICPHQEFQQQRRQPHRRRENQQIS